MRTTKGLMHKNVITTTPGSTLVEAYKLMRSKEIRHLPVLSDGKLVGMLSDRDIQRAMITKQISELQQELHLPQDLKVSDFMNWPVYTVHEETPVNLVAEAMLKQKISAVIVENEMSNVIGIVTTDDMLAYLLSIINEVERPKIFPISNYLY